jgi:hypothetical protein
MPRKAPIIKTTTDEFYLPTRLVYTVHQPDTLRRWFDRHPAMSWDPDQQRWTWNYHRKLRKLGFPAAYEEAVQRQGGLVLASCYLAGKRTLHVYTRSTLRAHRFLVFFDREVSRNVAMGEFVDEYNLLTTGNDFASVPTPEDFFRDESKFEFLDIGAMMDAAKTPAEEEALDAMLDQRRVTKTIAPLERHRLEMFYTDGPKSFEHAMNFRELMAMLQHQSPTPINPYTVIKQHLEGALGSPSDPARPEPLTGIKRRPRRGPWSGGA